MKTELENYLEGVAADESLEQHDRKYHPNGFDPETDTCKKREGMAKGDDPKLWKDDKGEAKEVSANGGEAGNEPEGESIPEGESLVNYFDDLTNDELDECLGDIGNRLKGIKFDLITLGDVDDTGSGSLTYETPMVSSTPEVEEDGGEWVVKTRIEPTVGKNAMKDDARKIDDDLNDIGLGSYVYSPELAKLSSEDETGMRTAKMKSDFSLKVRDNAKFWKYVKGFRKPHSEEEAA